MPTQYDTARSAFHGILDRIRILTNDIKSAGIQFERESTVRAGADEALSNRILALENIASDLGTEVGLINTAVATERARIDALVAQLVALGVDAGI